MGSGTCVNHPERETSYECLKYKVFMCEECLKCKDPEIYCKYRSACPISFMDKEKKREMRQNRNHTAKEREAL